MIRRESTLAMLVDQRKVGSWNWSHVLRLAAIFSLMPSTLRAACLCWWVVLFAVGTVGTPLVCRAKVWFSLRGCGGGVLAVRGHEDDRLGCHSNATLPDRQWCAKMDISTAGVSLATSPGLSAAMPTQNAHYLVLGEGPRRTWHRPPASASFGGRSGVFGALFFFSYWREPQRLCVFFIFLLFSSGKSGKQITPKL